LGPPIGGIDNAMATEDRIDLAGDAPHAGADHPALIPS
jgi:hypothetical protein